MRRKILYVRPKVICAAPNVICAARKVICAGQVIYVRLSLYMCGIKNIIIISLTVCYLCADNKSANGHPYTYGCPFAHLLSAHTYFSLKNFIDIIIAAHVSFEVAQVNFAPQL